MWQWPESSHFLDRVRDGCGVRLLRVLHHMGDLWIRGAFVECLLESYICNLHSGHKRMLLTMLIGCCNNQECQHLTKKLGGLNIMYLTLSLFAFLGISVNLILSWGVISTFYPPPSLCRRPEVASHFNSVTALESCICPHLLLRAPEMLDPGGGQDSHSVQLQISSFWGFPLKTATYAPHSFPKTVTS